MLGLADSVIPAPSSSLMVTLVPTTCMPEAVPSTQTVSLGSTTESSVGVSVKVPVAVVELAGKVRVMSDTAA